MYVCIYIHACTCSCPSIVCNTYNRCRMYVCMHIYIHYNLLYTYIVNNYIQLRFCPYTIHVFAIYGLDGLSYTYIHTYIHTHTHTYIHTYINGIWCFNLLYWRMQNNCTTSDRFKRSVFQRCRLLLVVNVKNKSHSGGANC
jgi:hypothetical protein